MSYLIDTNVVSEVLKKTPNAAVLRWFKAIPSEQLFISVLTLGEIRKGIERCESRQRKTALLKWLEHSLPAWFGENVLSIDADVADRWGFLTATVARPLPAIDGLLAATALTHNLKMVTRNEKDFLLPGLEVLNPFEGI